MYTNMYNTLHFRVLREESINYPFNEPWMLQTFSPLCLMRFGCDSDRVLHRKAAP